MGVTIIYRDVENLILTLWWSFQIPARLSFSLTSEVYEAIEPAWKKKIGGSFTIVEGV